MLTFKGKPVADPKPIEIEGNSEPSRIVNYQVPTESKRKHDDIQPAPPITARDRTFHFCNDLDVFITYRKQLSAIAPEIVFLDAQLNDPALVGNPHREWGLKRQERLETQEDAALWGMVNALYPMDSIWQAMTARERLTHCLHELVGIDANVPRIGPVLMEIRAGPLQEKAPLPDGWHVPRAFIVRLPEHLLRLTDLVPF